MSLKIREWTPDDYAALVAIENAVYPDYPATVAEWQHNDDRRPPGHYLQRWVAERDGVPVGYAAANHSEWHYHPQKFNVGASVPPEFQGQGVGRALYAHLLEALQPQNPIELRAACREDHHRSLRFLGARGYTETMREWESRLPVAAFDPAPFAGAEERLTEQGIRIRTLREVQAEEPDWAQKLYSLKHEVEADVPRSASEFTPPSFETFMKRFEGNPNLLPDGYFIAEHNGQYVGISQLFRNQTNQELDTGLTGVRRSHRRMGIALALKLRAIEYARRHGHPVIKTWNETNNHGMLSINVRLGFVRQPAWIDYMCILR